MACLHCRTFNVDFALHKACEDGHAICATALIHQGICITKQLEDGATALLIACEGGFTECAQACINGGADVNCQRADGHTALYEACEYNHLDCARLCVAAGADANIASMDGATPLFIACQTSHLECARVCLDAGADVDAARTGGATALYVSVSAGNIECAKLCLAAGANHRVRSEGDEPLHIASAFGFLDCVQLLLDAGSLDLESRSAGGGTAMQIGCRGGHPRVVQLLSSHGANGRICGRHKWDPRAARDFALDLLLIGFSLSRSPRFAGEEQALLDIWLDRILPLAVTFMCEDMRLADL